MKKIILWICGIIVAAAVCLGGYGYYKIHHTTSAVYSYNKKTSSTSDNKTKATKSVAYLMLGTDTGALGRAYKGRTDTIMVMVVNPKTNKTTMVSIARDTKIEYKGETIKLNAAYAYGSSDTAIAAVEKLLDIKLDGYILVNMGGLKKLVNAVGGVSVTSPISFSEGGYTFTKGKTETMDGAKALEFSRMRHEDPRGDYGRQERQQLIVKAILQKAKSQPTSLLNTNFLDAVSDNVRTNISLSSLKNLASKYKSAIGNISSDQMQGSSAMIDGQSYEVMSTSEINRVHSEINDAINAQ
ncbi:LCP family protein [Lacticaseibacillus pantheris]|jgi:LCP family protein required for cell wall assembly|uniref:Cell envelope-related transcriptional attenuator domain-containing protein n=1 Tax=Lacticaseibacillus pantheris DSM 15945 = JCM 12539 = NBRC 106106 TaxID=1423783 RepID=A0A0R1TZE9_9LACO|nr:LCP family protein [Lacticaseibacillus pantheris]KRL86486.1 hypothetical protein FC50_GL000735 [Lacticaseibacillus pantheris DSM 15945 = JCM 12539 = NBRC 106106]WKF84746.1 LCP family protein [Lacticaseibacillus pantheris]